MDMAGKRNGIKLKKSCYILIQKFVKLTKVAVKYKSLQRKGSLNTFANLTIMEKQNY